MYARNAQTNLGAIAWRFWALDASRGQQVCTCCTHGACWATQGCCCWGSLLGGPTAMRHSGGGQSELWALAAKRRAAQLGPSIVLPGGRHHLPTSDQPTSASSALMSASSMAASASRLAAWMAAMEAASASA